MKTLSDIEIEDILAGRAHLPDDADAASRQRLSDAQAMRSRVQQAYAATAAAAGLADRIRAALDKEPDAGQPAGEPVPSRTLRVPTWARRVLPGVAAAAMIAIAIGVWVIGDGTQRAYAQPELAEIHHANARHGNDFRPCHDGKGIARRIGKHCGRRVAVPVLPGGCQYVGSTLATFRDRTVASAVIESDGQAISVITLRDEAASLGFSHRQQRDGQTVYLCGYEDCRMAALTVDGVTLVATGDMDHDQLIVLLQAFAAANASPAAD